jgi:hypothetical protein
MMGVEIMLHKRVVMLIVRLFAGVILGWVKDIGAGGEGRVVELNLD